MILLTISEAKRLRFPLVYGLCDLSGAIFYVGKTIRPDKRFQTHREARGANRALNERVKKLGASVRVVVLDESPADINASEREEIRTREKTLLNLALADNWCWEKQTKDKPWSAGARNISPSQMVRLQVRPHVGANLSERLRRMGAVERCWTELNILADMPPIVRRRFRGWWEIVEPKMTALLDIDLGGVKTRLDKDAEEYAGIPT